MSTRRNCQYGENCYRKNPVHFKEYSHQHLDNILKAGRNEDTNKYEIPSELFMSKDIVEEQLSILEDIFPKLKSSVKKLDKIPNLRINEEKETSARDSSDIIMVDEEITETEISNSNLADAEKESNSENKFSLTIKKRNMPEWSSLRADKTNMTKTDKPKEIEKDSKENQNLHRKSPQPSTSSSTTDGSRLSKKPKIDRNIHEYIKVVLPKGNMAKKLENAAPYNMFLTTITSSPATHYEPLSITLQEILDDSLGEIESSLQINFMVDVGWLLGHYYFAGCLDKPLLILYGDETPELQTISKMKPQVTAVKVNMPSPFATHHTKMMIFNYKDDSMRVVISTANLYEDDWHNRTQGVWISPKLPPLLDDADTNAGDSITNFKQDLMLYLVEYKIPKLQPWIAKIRKTDFSSINVFFIASAPGGFRSSSVRGHPFGHARLGQLLGKHSAKIDESVAVVAQSSSIGSLGPNVQTWIGNDFINSLRRDSAPLGIRRIPQFKFIYPSYNNVKKSHDDLLGGGCLPYGKNTNDKQPWLRNHLYQWKSISRSRNQAMPHIKTYCRWSENNLFWFVLTSANLSKAAWGSFNKTAKIEPALRIMNYEVGVLFLPKFLTGENTFPLREDRDGVPAFPMPYDIPLHPYGPDDKPFLMDYLMN